jgi:hypothetical protein
MARTLNKMLTSPPLSTEVFKISVENTSYSCVLAVLCPKHSATANLILAMYTYEFPFQVKTKVFPSLSYPTLKYVSFLK